MPANWYERSEAATGPLRFSLSNCSMPESITFCADLRAMKPMLLISRSKRLAGFGNNWTILQSDLRFRRGFTALHITSIWIGGGRMGERRRVQTNGGRRTQALDLLRTKTRLQST